MSAAKPCDTCPYLRTTPVGIWHPEEYSKLQANDHDTGSTFGCHLNDGSLCRGWLADQKRRGIPNLNLRLRLMCNSTDLDTYKSVNPRDPDLYTSIAEMCDANRGRAFPKRSKKARKLEKMKRTR